MAEIVPKAKTIKNISDKVALIESLVRTMITKTEHIRPHECKNFTSLEASLTASENRIRLLESHVAQSQGQLEQSKLSLASLEEKNKLFDIQLQKAQEQIRCLSTKQVESESKIKAIEQKTSQKIKKLMANWNDKLQDMEKKCQVKNCEIEKLSKHLNELEQSKKQIENKLLTYVNDTKATIHNMKKETEMLKSKTKILDFGIQENNSKAIDFHNRLTTMSIKLYRLKKQYDDDAEGRITHAQLLTKSNHLLTKRITAVYHSMAMTQEQREQACVDLFESSKNGCLEGVKSALKNGADIERMSDKVSPLMMAARNGHAAAIIELLKNGADVNAYADGLNLPPLFCAIRYDHYEAVRILLGHGANIEMRILFKETPLIYACRLSSFPIIELILKQGADVNSFDNQNHTAIWWAARRGHEHIVSWLLNLGADANVSGRLNTTPLMAASMSGCPSTVRSLINRPSDVTRVDRNSRTALWVAAEHGRDEVIKILLDNGSEIDVADVDGCTPLMAASRMGNISTVKLLLELSANHRITNNKGLSAFDVAGARNPDRKEEVRQIFQDYFAK